MVKIYGLDQIDGWELAYTLFKINGSLRGIGYSVISPHIWNKK